MAKKQQSFADKVAKTRGGGRSMAKLVVSVKKANGHHSFKTRMVNINKVKEEIAAAKS
jgi:hypothetical protein